MFKKNLFTAAITALTFFAMPHRYLLAQTKKQIAKQDYKNGDIIFQSSNSRQCQAIKYATHSDISHCGMLLNDGGEWYVVEAVEPVQKIKLTAFINRDAGQHYAIKRMKESDAMTDQIVAQMRTAAVGQIGKHYDIYFNWSNNEIYCSELVWKLYNEAGIKLCEPRKLKDFDLTHPLVVMMMKERYGSKIPYEEPVVAPSDIYHSDLLTLVEER